MTTLEKTLIRQYQSKDLDDLLFAWDKANRLAHPFLTEAFIQQERHNIEHLYLPNADTWVAENNHRVVGFIALIHNEVGGLFLHPDFHGSGLGKALMDKANHLHSALELDVFKANALGRAFYQHYGFSQQSESIHEATGQPVLRLVYPA